VDRVVPPEHCKFLCFRVTDIGLSGSQPNHFVRTENPVILDPAGVKGVPDVITQTGDGHVELREVIFFPIKLSIKIESLACALFRNFYKQFILTKSSCLKHNVIECTLASFAFLSVAT
jgi:hypothetical protein